MLTVSVIYQGEHNSSNHKSEPGRRKLVAANNIDSVISFGGTRIKKKKKQSKANNDLGKGMIRNEERIRKQVWTSVTPVL